MEADELDALPLGTFQETFEPHVPEDLQQHLRKVASDYAVKIMQEYVPSAAQEWLDRGHLLWDKWGIHFHVRCPPVRTAWRYVRIEAVYEGWQPIPIRSIVMKGRFLSPIERGDLEAELRRNQAEAAVLSMRARAIRDHLRLFETVDYRPTFWTRLGDLG